MASTDQRCRTSCRGRLAPAGLRKWRNPPDLNPGCWWPHVRLSEGDIPFLQGKMIGGIVKFGPPCVRIAYIVIFRSIY